MPDHYYVEDFEDGTLTSSTGRIDRHPLIADTLTSGSHPASNMPGRRREDDTNIVIQGGSQQDQFVPLDGVSPTLAHANNHHMGHHQPKALTASGVRRLTPRECERLQGFPDDWTLIPGASDSKRYAALGDAVTVPVAEWIGRRLMTVAA